MYVELSIGRQVDAAQGQGRSYFEDSHREPCDVRLDSSRIWALYFQEPTKEWNLRLCASAMWGFPQGNQEKSRTEHRALFAFCFLVPMYIKLKSRNIIIFLQSISKDLDKLAQTTFLPSATCYPVELYLEVILNHFRT